MSKLYTNFVDKIACPRKTIYSFQSNHYLHKSGETNEG